MGRQIVIGQEYNIRTVKSARHKGLYQARVLREKPSGNYDVEVTAYTFPGTVVYVGRVMAMPPERILLPVASTNKGFVSLLSKED